MRTIRVRDSETMVALPKMSREQFTDIIKLILKLLGNEWELKQVGFGNERAYKLFLRPNTMSIFKTRDSDVLPVWVKNLQPSLPLSSRQILSFAESRESYKADLYKEDKTASLSINRNGFLRINGLSREEVENLLDPVERKIIDKKYNVWHDIKLDSFSHYECSYFVLNFTFDQCIITIKSRLEFPGLWKDARSEFRLYLTVDELLIIETLIKIYEKNYNSVQWCCQVPGGSKFLPGKVIKRYKIRKSSLGFIETSPSILLSTLEETRLFSTFTSTPIFVPCMDQKIILFKEKVKQNNEKFSPSEFISQIRSELSEWCFDSCHLLDLKEVWKDLYPGDWK